MSIKLKTLLGTSLLVAASTATQASVLLYDQNFESQNTAYINSSLYDDLTQQTVNDLYGNQPAGFSFIQDYTVETLSINGGTSFGGSGYSDPSGKGGNYALGMLSHVQNDKLGLRFNVGSFDFLNFQMDFSSIGVTGYNGPSITATSQSIPKFRLELRDGFGFNGTLLDYADVTGVSSDPNTFSWTNTITALDAKNTTTGDVTLVLDLLQGNYAAMDNFRIAASNTSGDLASVSEPGTMALLGLGLLGLGYTRRKSR